MLLDFEDETCGNVLQLHRGRCFVLLRLLEKAQRIADCIGTVIESHIQFSVHQVHCLSEIPL